MKTHLYFLEGFNNYYDRRIRKYNGIGEYAVESSNDHALYDTNFNPGDGINTTLVVGATRVPLNFSPDYMIECSDGENANSRWFVIEMSRIREGQYTLTLRRDVVADFWDNIRNADSFIEKATVGFNDPAIYNSENMTFNQIKSGEVLLKDKTGCPWLVAYIDKNYSVVNGPVPTTDYINTPYINIPTTLEGWSLYDNTSLSPNTQWLNSSISSASYNIYSYTGASGYYRYYSTSYSGSGTTTETINRPGSSGIVDNRFLGGTVQSAYEGYGLNLLNTILRDNILQMNEDAINYNGKVLRFSDGTFYKVTSLNNKTLTQTIHVTAGTPLWESMFAVGSRVGFNTYTPNTNAFTVDVKTNQIQLNLTRQSEYEISYNIKENRIKTVDAPYDVIALPFGAIEVKNTLGETVVAATDKDVALTTISAISVQGGTNVYDIQLVPYCPIPSAILEEGTVIVPVESMDVIGTTNQNITALFYIHNARFDGVIELETPVTITEPKVQCLCDKHRLCSPNYASVFEINAAMNGGLSTFEYDCEYKPFSPYIHINPVWGGLYGGNFNDARGLVCGGDFSLAQITDQWKQYEINNKNYQLMFDRQIENMRVQHRWGMGESIAGAITGTATGAASGAIFGGTFGGVGAGIGAAVGGVLSAAAGAVDVAKMQVLYKENLDYTKDQFGYTLGNIQALPNTLTKISAFNPNNKLFPVLEYYTCTDIEKQALRDKIKYNGMTVMRIGKIENFITQDTSYIKAKPILLKQIHDDFHVAAELASELNMGIRVNGGLT